MKVAALQEHGAKQSRFLLHSWAATVPSKAGRTAAGCRYIGSLPCDFGKARLGRGVMQQHPYRVRQQVCESK